MRLGRGSGSEQIALKVVNKLHNAVSWSAEAATDDGLNIRFMQSSLASLMASQQYPGVGQILIPTDGITFDTAMAKAAEVKPFGPVSGFWMWLACARDWAEERVQPPVIAARSTRSKGFAMAEEMLGRYHLFSGNAMHAQDQDTTTGTDKYSWCDLQQHGSRFLPGSYALAMNGRPPTVLMRSNGPCPPSGGSCCPKR